MLFRSSFLNSFQRGNRDTVQREQAGSILMMLELMNSPMVTDRVRLQASPFLRSLGDMPSVEAAVEEMFLAFLSRRPTEAERAAAMQGLARASSPGQGVEDLAWALVNRVDFLFSY